MLAAVIFDLDGTLVSSERYAQQAIEDTLRGLGYHLNAEQRDYIIGRAWQEIWAKYEQELGITMPLPQFIDRYMVEYERLSREHSAGLPGAVALVQRLAERKLPMAVVSGSSRREVGMHLGLLGILDHFPWYMGAEDYSRGKPDPEPYQKAIARLGVAPERTVVIEDSRAGILAARAAGIPVIGVRAGNFAGQDQSAATLLVDTLTDVTDAVLDRLTA